MLNISIWLQGYPEITDWVFGQHIILKQSPVSYDICFEGAPLLKSFASIHLLIVIPVNVTSGKGAQ